MGAPFLRRIDMYETLTERYETLLTIEKARKRLYNNLVDELEIFKESLLDEIVKFENYELENKTLEVIYDDGFINLFFKDDFSQFGRNKIMKAVNSSLTFKVYIDDPCTDRDFDTVSIALYNIFGVAVVY